MSEIITFQPVDWIIILFYGAVIFTVGIFVVRKPVTTEGYFLAGRKLRWPLIGASMLASNISAEHFVGLAGGGYLIGMAIGAAYEWSAIFCLLPLILVFLSFYLKNRIFTVPEFLEQRFDASVRLLLSWIMVVFSILTKISISLWASALVFRTLFDWDPAIVIWIVAIVTALYTMKGGLTTVVYTDAIQTVVLLAGGCVLTALGLRKVGGIGALHAKLPAELFDAFKPASDPNIPWTGAIFGIMCLGGAFYWSMDQVIVQRAFAARDLNEGRKGAIFAGALKLLIPFVLVVPGMIARALWPALPQADQAYPKLLGSVMPHGLLGLTVAGLTAALMGHMSATFNSISTMFTRDLYLRRRPNADHKRQILVGRIVVVAVAVLGVLWAPVIGRFGSLWDYLQQVSMGLIVPFAGVFFFGVAWKRITTRGVWAGTLAGFALAIVLMSDRMWTHLYGHSPFLPFMHTMYLEPWLHGAIIEFLISAAVMIAVSMRSMPEPAEKVATTTISWSALRPGTGTEPKRPFLQDYKPWLVLVLATAILLYVIFSIEII
jgi:SSS family solute:Na+ symporter